MSARSTKSTFSKGLAGHPHVRGTSLRNDLIPPVLLIPFHPHRFPTDFVLFLPIFSFLTVPASIYVSLATLNFIYFSS